MTGLSRSLEAELADIAGLNGRAGLPDIQMDGRQLRDVVSDMLAALGTDPDVFVQGGALVRVRRDEDGTPTVERLTVHSLRGVVSGRANFLERSKDAIVKTDYVNTLLTLAEWEGIRTLDGITQAPVLRPDGSVVREAGYDEATRLMYVPETGLSVPPIPECPTPDDMLAAAALFRELLRDFPFDSDASLANAVALVLTPIMRPTITGQVLSRSSMRRARAQGRDYWRKSSR